MAFEGLASGLARGFDLIGQHRAQMRGLQQAAGLFDSLGTPAATAYAQLLRTDPNAAAEFAGTMGGVTNLYGAMGQEASARAASAAATAKAGRLERGLDIKEKTAEARLAEASTDNARADARLGETLRHNAATEANAAATQGRLLSNADQATIASYQKGYESDVKKLTEREQYGDAAQETLNLAKAGNPIASEAAKSQLARLSGEVGVLTDYDVARFGGSKAWKERVSQAVQQASDGTLTAKNAAFLQEIIDSFKGSLARQKQKRAGVFVEKLRKAKGGTIVESDEQAWGLIAPGLDMPGAEPPSSSTPPTAKTPLPQGARRIQNQQTGEFAILLQDGSIVPEGQ